MLTFNEFQRELKKRVSDPQVAYMLSYIFETIIEQNKQLDDMATLLDQMANAMQGFASLHEKDQALVRQLLRRGRPDGVEVHSVANDPDEETRQ